MLKLTSVEHIACRSHLNKSFLNLVTLVEDIRLLLLAENSILIIDKIQLLNKFLKESCFG